MVTPRLLRLALVAAALVAGTGGALASTAQCRQARAELASLGPGGGGREAARLARQLGGDVQRLEATYEAMGCGRGGFFGDPPQCAGVASRLRAAQAEQETLLRETARQIGAEQRRRRLEAAVERACAEERPEPQPERVAARRGEDGASKPAGGSRLVCVRACDGFFFPLQNLPARGDADDMCRALCPAAETAAYSMPLDGTIDQAVSQRGKPYTALPNALKYTQGVDRSCSCRKPGQTWSEALARAERMLARNRDDVVVSAAKAEELSRPKLLRPKPERSRREVAGRPPEAFAVATTGSIGPAPEGADARTAARTGESAPTAGRASSGIGGDAPQGPRLVSREEGQAAPDAAGRRPVRVIAPDVVAVPKTQ